LDWNNFFKYSKLSIITKGGNIAIIGVLKPKEEFSGLERQIPQQDDGLKE
jgi:hypothetical protein